MDFCIAELIRVKRKIRISKKKQKMVDKLLIIDHLPEIMKALEVKNEKSNN